MDELAMRRRLKGSVEDSETLLDNLAMKEAARKVQADLDAQVKKVSDLIRARNDMESKLFVEGIVEDEGEVVTLTELNENTTIISEDDNDELEIEE